MNDLDLMENIMIRAKMTIISLLMNYKDDIRVKNELAQLSDKNYLELYYAKQITDFLKENHEYYIVKSNNANLSINYLLGITDYSPNNYLPYELLFYKKKGNLKLNIVVSKRIKKKLSEFIFGISNLNSSYGYALLDDGRILKHEFKHVIALDGYNIPFESLSIDSSKVIIINVFTDNKIDLVNRCMEKYGKPNSNFIDDKELNERMFNDFSLIDVYYKNLFELGLTKCKHHEFYYYVYAYAGAKGDGLLDQIIDEDSFDKDKYPTTIEMLYHTLKSKGLDDTASLEICHLINADRYKNLDNYKKWNDLMELIPEDLANYLSNVEYMYSAAECIAYAKLYYMLGYYLINYKDFYEQKYYVFMECEEM